MSELSIKNANKLEKRRLKEKREIGRLEKELLRPKHAGYIFYMLFIVCMVYVADEVASQIGGQMQTIVAHELFAPIFGAEKAVARMSLVKLVTLVAGVLAFIYKPLSDRYGRKRFLVINTLGMGVGLLLISVSTGIPVFLIGSCFITFFAPNDVQAVYILETAPTKHRAKIYSTIKGVATLGLMLVPILRRVTMGEDTSKWRYVYVYAGLIGVVAAVFALVFVRETDVFVNTRLKFLRTSEEERAKNKADKSSEASQGGLIVAFKFAMKHKQLRWLMIGNGFLLLGVIIAMYYETILSNGYSAQYITQGMGITEAAAKAAPLVTQALLLFPVGSAFFQIIQGFLSDKWGRKPTAVLMCVFSIISYLLFFIGSAQSWNPYFIGFFCGGAIGAFWSAGDVIGNIMCAESTPTNLRASMLALPPIISAAISGIALVLALGVINVLGDQSIGIVSLCLFVPGVVISMIIFLKNVRDTKGVDLATVTGEEWD